MCPSASKLRGFQPQTEESNWINNNNQWQRVESFHFVFKVCCYYQHQMKWNTSIRLLFCTQNQSDDRLDASSMNVTVVFMLKFQSILVDYYNAKWYKDLTCTQDKRQPRQRHPLKRFNTQPTEKFWFIHKHLIFSFS